MKELLRFIYTLRVENIDSLASKLLHASEKYELSELKSMCGSELIRQLSEKNVFETMLSANRYNEESLLDECMDFINS
jgi:speckle-type POZ protein